jgi:LysR family transcriptional regulator, nitrogen assimilation regulatory protein
MDLRQFRYFLCVAELASFTRASERLNVAQSALSRQIRNLEIDLGVDLFVRHGKRVRLSSAGAQLLMPLRQILADVDQLSNIIGRETSPTVAIAGHHSIGNLLFPRVAKRASEEVPSIRVSFMEGTMASMGEWLRTEKAHLAIFGFVDMDFSPQVPGVAFESLCREQVCQVQLRGDDTSTSCECSIEDAFSRPMIMMPKPNHERLQYERLAARHGISLNVVLEADTMALRKALARDSGGSFLLPCCAAKGDFLGSEWLVTSVRGLTLHRVLARRSTGKTSAPLEAVAAIVRREMLSLSASGHFGSPAIQTLSADTQP